MKIAFLSGGAAGMYCGSCIHDNTLASTLQRQGHDAVLVPLYTPLRTDEPNVSIDRVFFGAVNTYLAVRAPRLGKLLRPLGRLLDRPKLLDWVGRLGSSADAKELGELTLAVLEGEHGPTGEALEQLVEWLATDLKPEIVHLQNSLFLGLGHRLREELGVPVVCSLQGEDLFLDELIEPYHSRALQLLEEKRGHVDGFVAHSRYYAGHMSQLMGLPEEAVSVVPLGLNLEDFPAPEPDAQGDGDRRFTVGYLARICPEKGFGLAVEGFRELAQRAGKEHLRLRVAGYLAPKDEAFFEQQRRRLEEWGLAECLDYVGEVDRAGKVSFLHSLDVLSVPTVYHEPKGLFALEALASGVPVVLPRHGAFPELVETTGGGLLVESQSAESVGAALDELRQDPELRRRLSESGRREVRQRHGADAAAETLLEVYRAILGKATPSDPIPSGVGS